jgi:hypothetical protein
MFHNRNYRVRATHSGEEIRAVFDGVIAVGFSDEPPAEVESIELVSLEILGVELDEEHIAALPDDLREAVMALANELEFEGVE